MKEISDGYALNFVIPRGLGVRATESEIKKIQSQKSASDAEKKVQEELLAKSLDDLSAITVTIKEKANDKGHLFEGIHKERVVDEIKKTAGIALDPEYIELPKPLKEVGQFLVQIAAHGKKGKVKVVVEAEG